MENILELRQVSKTYPKSGFTLDRLSLSLPYGMVMGLTTLFNTFFPNGMSTWQIVMSGVAILLCGVLLFSLSYPLTVFLFWKKEY